MSKKTENSGANIYELLLQASEKEKKEKKRPNGKIEKFSYSKRRFEASTQN